MAIEPIKGFYVHDESTDTDGVAQYDAGALENLDRSLTERYRAPDSKAVGDRLSAVEAVADEANEIAERLNEGGLELKDEVLAENISAWLSEHPEATTTVEDGALTQSKLSDSLDARKLSFYSTVSEMQEDEQCRLGATAISDGAVYTVRSAVEVNDPEDMVDPSVLYKYDGQYYHGGLTENDRQIATGYECVNGFALFIAPYKNAYATPEQFGAVGDGVIDDTAAWQKAVDSGLNVKATNGKIYKIGQVTITKNIDIDCGMASFIQTGNNLFLATGTAVATTGQSANYSHYQSDYALTDTNKPNYTGYAFLKGTNSLDLSRSYYFCGFPASFKNGYMTETYPVDVENPTVTYYTPITVHIRNILDITAASGVSDVAYLNGIHIKYGVNCSVENVNASDVHVYTLINIDTCLNTFVNQIFTHSDAVNASNNSYMLAVMDSCFTNIENCELNNDNWHCITTGGTTLVYKTTVRNCALYTKYQYAYCDHANAIDTVIDNVTATFGVLVAQNGEIRNTKIYAHNNNSNKGWARISLTPSNFDYLGQFTVENVNLYENNNSEDGSVGIVVESNLGTGGVHSIRYLQSLTLDNVYGIDPTKSKQHQMYISLHSSDLEHQLIVSKLKLNNTNLPYNGNNDTRYNVDLTNCVYELNNVVCQLASGSALLPLGTTGLTMPYKIYIDKTEFSYFRGNYKDIYFGTINFNGFDATKSTFTGQIIGDIWNNQYNISNFEMFKDCTIFSVNRFKYMSGQIGMNCRLHNSTFVFNTQHTKNVITMYADTSTNWVATQL